MKNITTIFLVAALTACVATETYFPLVDLTDEQTETQYNNDANECRRLVGTQSGAGSGAATGAVGGAILGGLIMAAMGGDSSSIGRVAGAGAVTGAASVGAATYAERVEQVDNCLRGRGYRVL